jgi:hypothetical protein
MGGSFNYTKAFWMLSVSAAMLAYVAEAAIRAIKPAGTGTFRHVVSN